MTILISKNGKITTKIVKSSFKEESSLQKFIYENPDSIPLYEIKEDIRLLVVAKEFSTRSGSIDALGFDGAGNIYLIETKLYKNPDKRLVVAQVLDYGASLWKDDLNFDDFMSKIERQVLEKFKVSFNQKIKDFFDIDDDEVLDFKNNIRKNLNEGRFKFVVLMDKLHEELKNLILFINQNSKFDLYAVEIEYYKYEDYEIVIPKLYGAEVKKDIGVASSGERRTWDEPSFFSQAKEILKKDELEILKDIYQFARRRGVVVFGNGMSATFRMRSKTSEFQKNIFTTFSSGRTWIGVGWISKFFGMEVGKWLANEITKIGVNIPQDKNLEHAYPEFNMIKLNHEQIDIFKKIVDILCQKIEKINLQQT